MLKIVQDLSFINWILEPEGRGDQVAGVADMCGGLEGV